MSTLLKKAKEDYEKEREKMKLHNSTTGEFPLNKIAAEAYKVPREALKQKENEAEKLPVPVIIQENNPIDFEDVTTPNFQWSNVTHILKGLGLSHAVIGDYVVIMNEREDVTFSGEPYIALQVWFNTRTGKIICRVWNETIATDTIVTIAQLTEACMSHLQGQPCQGFPIAGNEERTEAFVKVENPILRKVSRKCLKVLAKELDVNGNSCNECLKLGDGVPNLTEPECLNRHMQNNWNSDEKNGNAKKWKAIAKQT